MSGKTSTPLKEAKARRKMRKGTCLVCVLFLDAKRTATPTEFTYLNAETFKNSKQRKPELSSTRCEGTKFMCVQRSLRYNMLSF